MRIPRNTFMGSLGLLAKRGIPVRTIIDVGAAEGSFMLSVRGTGIYPDAKFFFVDAMMENQRLYELARERFGYGYAIAALSVIEGEATIEVDPHVYNTHVSTIQLDEPYGKGYAKRTVRARTLNSVVSEACLEEPFLVKIDVQGAELDVLRGGLAVLARASIVLVETPIFFERDTLGEVLSFFETRGFSLFDISELGYYPSNHVLFECYATFLRKDFDFRSAERWVADSEQERLVQERLQERRRRNSEAFELFCKRS